MIIKLRDPKDFSKRVMIAGFSQRSFAKHIKVSDPYMNQIFNEKRDPSAKIAKKMCEGLEVTFDDIFFIINDNKSYQIA
jgi:DNA-binding XRE family transcriptional regulator